MTTEQPVVPPASKSAWARPREAGRSARSGSPRSPGATPTWRSASCDRPRQVSSAAGSAASSSRRTRPGAYLAGRRPSRFEFIGFDQDEDAPPQQRWLRRLAGRRPIAVRTNDLDSQLAAARAGAGIALLPGFLAARHPELQRVPTRQRPFARDAWLVVHGDLRRAPAVRAVMEFLVEATSELIRPSPAARPAAQRAR